MSQPRGDVQVLVSTHTRAEKPWVPWRGALVFTHLVFWICLGLFGAVEVSPQVAEDFCAQHDRIALLGFVLELQPVLRLSAAKSVRQRVCLVCLLVIAVRTDVQNFTPWEDLNPCSGTGSGWVGWHRGDAEGRG